MFGKARTLARQQCCLTEACWRSVCWRPAPSEACERAQGPQACAPARPILPARPICQKIGQNGRPGRREPPRSISFDETSRMVSYRFGVGDEKSVFVFLLLPSERIDGLRAKTVRKTMRERVLHPSKTRQKGTKRGRLHRPLCVRVFGVSGRGNALAHSFSRS